MIFQKFSSFFVLVLFVFERRVDVAVAGPVSGDVEQYWDLVSQVSSVFYILGLCYKTFLDVITGAKSL